MSRGSEAGLREPTPPADSQVDLGPPRKCLCSVGRHGWGLLPAVSCGSWRLQGAAWRLQSVPGLWGACCNCEGAVASACHQGANSHHVSRMLGSRRLLRPPAVPRDTGPAMQGVPAIGGGGKGCRRSQVTGARRSTPLLAAPCPASEPCQLCASALTGGMRSLQSHPQAAAGEQAEQGVKAQDSVAASTLISRSVAVARLDGHHRERLDDVPRPRHAQRQRPADVRPQRLDERRRGHRVAGRAVAKPCLEWRARQRGAERVGRCG